LKVPAVGLDGMDRGIALAQRLQEVAHRFVDDCRFHIQFRQVVSASRRRYENALASRLRSGMMLLVHALQSIQRQVRVHLRG
jgi:hypothetical protein